MANLLDFEAKQSREKAGEVMAKIMKNTAEEKKVIVQYFLQFSFETYMFHFRLVLLSNLLSVKYRKPSKI